MPTMGKLWRDENTGEYFFAVKQGTDPASLEERYIISFEGGETAEVLDWLFGADEETRDVFTAAWQRTMQDRDI